VGPLTISNQGSFSYGANGNQTNESSGVTNDPGTPAPNDPTSFTVPPPAIPALSHTVLLLLSALLAMIALVVVRRATS
jgi:hypothetical protein